MVKDHIFLGDHIILGVLGAILYWKVVSEFWNMKEPKMGPQHQGSWISHWRGFRGPWPQQEVPILGNAYPALLDQLTAVGSKYSPWGDTKTSGAPKKCPGGQAAEICNSTECIPHIYNIFNTPAFWWQQFWGMDIVHWTREKGEAPTFESRKRNLNSLSSIWRGERKNEYNV